MRNKEYFNFFTIKNCFQFPTKEFLASSDAFQLIAIDQKNNVKFTSADSIPDGAPAIIFKKPKGVKIDQANMGEFFNNWQFSL